MKGAIPFSAMKTTSLQRRIAIYLLFPMFVLLLGMGGAGFLFAGKTLLDQWGETAVAKLQATAHRIDMRLGRPKEMLLLLAGNNGAGGSAAARRFIIEHLRELPGVVQVEVDWPGAATAGGGPLMGMMPMHRRGRENLRVTPPRYDAGLNTRTISVTTDFRDSGGAPVGRVEVVLSFDDLVGQVAAASWWKSYNAYVVDDRGNILAGSRRPGRTRRFGTASALEKRTLAALRAAPSGTVFGPGLPPREIGGFYHLKEAPWTLVVIAPGDRVLEPFLRFRKYYFSGCALFILVVLVFIRLVIGRTAAAVKMVSEAASELAAGRFGRELPVTSADEVGELTRTFNTMSRQLEDRLRLKKAMAIAQEVQRNLLPASGVSLSGASICGVTHYCDETGGDYYDIIRFAGLKNTVCVVVGDVVGHGVGAALLMTTTRALVRGRLSRPGGLAQAVSDVNRLLCLDTAHMGNFVTLFVMLVEADKNRVRWVRAGHDPAMLAPPGCNEVEDLKGDGVILGVDENWTFVENSRAVEPGSVILIATDGAWEVENPIGERLGRDRLKEMFLAARGQAPCALVAGLGEEIDAFRADARRTDDVTMVAVAFDG